MLVATCAKADSLGVPEAHRIYLASSAFAEDTSSIAARPDLSASAAMASTGLAALAAARLEVDDLSCFDLYSCFPSSLNLACDALGLSPTDPRNLTVRGGLPYAEGPASAYLLHAIASIVEVLRREPGAALVTGVGMNLQRHIAAAYGRTPGWAPTAPAAPAAPPESLPLAVTFAGEAVVAAFTVATAATANRSRAYPFLTPLKAERWPGSKRPTCSSTRSPASSSDSGSQSPDMAR